MLPNATTRRLERAYRQGRSRVMATRYGNPGQGLQVIVVVGTNGKTTTARFLEEMLNEAGQTTASLLAVDNQVFGAKLLQTFLRESKKSGVRYVIITLNAVDMRHRSFGGTPIELVVVTGVSDTIDESAGEQEQAIEQLLAQQPRFTVLNRDDPYFDHLAIYPAGDQRMTYGRHEEAEARITRVSLYKKGSEVELVVDHQTTIQLATHLVGEANVDNLVAAAAGLYVMGENINTLDEGAARLESISANYQYIESATPYNVVLDRAPNEAALELVVATAKQLAKRRLLAVVQADITSEDCLTEVAKQTARLVVVDASEEHHSKRKVERVASADEAVNLALRAARKDDTVLLAGPLFAHRVKGGKSYAETAVTNFRQEQ